MAQRSERCPHCLFVGADVLRYERRPGIVVTYLICRSCGDDYMTTEEPTEPSPSFDPWTHFFFGTKRHVQ